MSRRFILLGVLTTWMVGATSAQAAPPAMTRSEMADLAEYGVDYSYWWGHGKWGTTGVDPGSCSGSCPSCTHSGANGADCSGFVAKCWQVPVSIALEQDSHPYSTSNFRWDSTHWSQIGWGDALLSDAFVYRNSGNTGGHIVLHETGDPWGQVWVWEAKGCSYGIVHNLKSLSSSYVAIRRDGISEQPQNGTLRGVVFEELGVGTADMSIRLAGANVECLGVGNTSASAPDADFSFDVPPGSYTVTGTMAGYLDNTRTCQVNAGQETWCSLGLVAECEPDCSGRSCGLDPVCGEPCGTCPVGDSCLPSGLCESVTECETDCSGRICGPDPVCEAPCGVCPASLVCTDLGQCVPIEPTEAKVYGFVVAVPPGTTEGLISYPTVPGAAVTVAGNPIGETDHFGYYEVVLTAGTFTIGASAEGHDPGEAVCTVEVRGYTECRVPVYTRDGPPTPDGGTGPGGTEGYRTGCGCGAPSGEGPTGLPGWLLVLGLLFLRRRHR